jgi:hypothetical protein
MKLLFMAALLGMSSLKTQTPEKKIKEEIFFYYEVKGSDTIQVQNGARIKSLLHCYDANGNLTEKYIDKSAIGETSTLKKLLVERSTYKQHKLIKTEKYSPSNGKKIQEVNYFYLPGTSKKEKEEYTTYDNEGKPNKLPNFVYVNLYSYISDTVFSVKSFLYDGPSKSLKLSSQKRIATDKKGNVIREVYLSKGNEVLETISFKYDKHENLLEKASRSFKEEYAYAKFDKFANWREMTIGYAQREGGQKSSMLIKRKLNYYE